MNKKVILFLAAATCMVGINLDMAVYAISSPFKYDLQQDINRPKRAPKKWEIDTKKAPAQNPTNTNKNTAAKQDTTASADAENTPSIEPGAIFLDKYFANMQYYPYATEKSAIAKYKAGNYTGSMQELYSILKKNSTNAVAYYYLAMVYTKIGEIEAAKSCYQMVITLNPNDTIVNYAQRGKSCLYDSTTCGIDPTTEAAKTIEEALSDLDKFIQAPFGNGFSEELNNQLRQKQLEKLQNKMNRGLPLTEEDMKKLEEFNKSEALTTDKLAMADDMPSNDEIINAVQVLKRAGLNISTEMPEGREAKPMKGVATSVPAKVEEIEDTPHTAQIPAQQEIHQQPQQNYYTPDPQFQQMSMMLNNGNANNSDPMMNMLPYMMQNNGKNMDPQMIQALMMNSMMNSLNGMNTNTNNN